MMRFRSRKTDIYVERIQFVARVDRRRAECEAVGRLVRRVFGDEAVLSHRSDGAPFIEGFGGYISISHGAGLAVLAVSALRPIGVDVECWRDSLLTVAPRVLDEAELQACGDDRMALLRAWTAKEAIFKAAGVEGLTLPEIRLPGRVGERRFAVRFFERGDRVLALAFEEDN